MRNCGREVNVASAVETEYLDGSRGFGINEVIKSQHFLFVMRVLLVMAVIGDGRVCMGRGVRVAISNGFHRVETQQTRVDRCSYM